MAGNLNSSTIRHLTTCTLVTACLLVALPAPALSVQRKKQIALEQYHKALGLREALNGRKQDDRTPEDYEKVIEAFRRVYHVAPTSTRADASALAVAELLAEQARLKDDEKGFKSAIAQYEFLCREYPGSKYRMEALFSTGQIYRQDLEDDASAKTAFEDFLRLYPRHHLAEEAKATLKDMADEARHPDRKFDTEVSAKRRHNDDGESDEVKVKATPAHHGLPLVTSLRYWSTPDYTRIAIDLDDEVKYEAGRVPSPDRIFFDLHNARLASELVGKSYNIDDGLLKKVRIAQFKANMARVVLEVDNLAEYSAFLLPNPYRLIIDVHGRKPAQTLTANANPAQDGENSNSLTGVPQTANPKHSTDRASVTEKSNASGDTGVVHKSASEAHATAAAIARQKEIETQDSDLGLAQITALSDDPEQVKATRKPTSGPVVQNVVPAESAKIAADDQSASTEHAPPITRRKAARNSKSARVTAGGHEALPTSAGDLSLIRALGLKVGRIVVDAGHGGHDTGTIGPNGLLEKDLVLDVALRLGKLLENKLGADVIYTRQDDTFVPLETRTAIANQNQADLFISIHANSSSDASARGVETYYLNFNSSPDALEVAARENAVSEKSVHELGDLVKKIALKEKIEESREFAATVQKSLHAGEAAKSPGVHDRGVKKAPFIVLIGANMPSILTEISFVSNPTDERKLRTPEYRQRIAESLYRGVTRYAQGLSGVKVASAKPMSGQ
jgi:N-acetylmuramoyl-L-alanine amidase